MMAAVARRHGPPQRTDSTDPIDYLFKFLIIGNAATGKSSLLNTLVGQKFKEDRCHTVGIEIGSKTVRVGARACKLQIWDTAGQERFRSVTKTYYRGAVGALLVYDVAARDSFNALGDWLADARHLASADTVVLLVGNKKDLDHAREVTYAEASQFARENDLIFLETSAKTGENVEEAFLKCARIVVEKMESGGALDAERTMSQSHSMQRLSSSSSGPSSSRSDCACRA